LVEAAQIDGANVFQRFRHIIFPLVAPAFTVSMFLTLSNSFKLYDQNLSLTGGAPYNATEPYFYEQLLKTKELILHYNQLPPSDSKGREKALKDLFGYCGVRPVVNSPFCCDFGCNISAGDYFFANFYLTILDEAKVSIGNHVYIGPGKATLL